jgi:ABC-type amino acid transport substrate-binding protein
MSDRRLFLLLMLALADRSEAAGAYRTVSQTGLALKFNPDPQGPPGFCVDYMRALHRVDATLQFQGLEEWLPLLRVESELAADHLDVFFGLLKTRERAERVRFIESPALYAIRHQVAVRADDSVKAETFDDIRALGANGVVLTSRGTGYISFLADQGGITVDSGAPDNGQNLRKLLSGRGRFFYQAGATLRFVIAQAKMQHEVRILPTVFHQEMQLVAHSPQLAPERVARLVAAMKQLENSGEAARIRAAYDV